MKTINNKLLKRLLNGKIAVEKNGVVIHTNEATRIAQSDNKEEMDKLNHLSAIAFCEVADYGTDAVYYTVNVDRDTLSKEQCEKLFADTISINDEYYKYIEEMYKSNSREDILYSSNCELGVFTKIYCKEDYDDFVEFFEPVTGMILDRIDTIRKEI